MVTPTLLIMAIFGDEGDLGVITGSASAVSAVVLYFIGRFSKPEHRIWIFSASLIFFAIGGFVNAALFNDWGVFIFMALFTISKPLHDVAYYPIQLKVIEYVSKIEGRNEFAYIFNHEYALWVGRIMGCLIFLGLMSYYGQTIALRFAPFVIGGLQIISIILAKRVISIS